MEGKTTMENNMLITLNINSIKYKLTDLSYSERLKRIFSILRCTKYNDCERLPSIIGLQEVILGYGDQYFDMIQKFMPEYKIIKPYGYKKENYKSSTNILLVRKDVLVRYVSKQLSSKENGGYLYNYIFLNTKFGKYIILNLHLPQLNVFEGRSDKYVKWRKEIRDCLLKSIYIEIAKHPDAKIIIMGDLNCLEDSEEILKLKALNMVNITEKNKPTYFNNDFGNKSIDYVFVSANMLTTDNDMKICTALVDDDVSTIHKLTDHALLKTLIKSK